MKQPCELCGKLFKPGAGMASHLRSCRKKQNQASPAADSDQSQIMDKASQVTEEPLQQASTVQPVTFEEYQAAQAPESAQQAAQRAEASVIRGMKSGAGTTGIMACLAEDGVGVPALIALACLRALPPALTDDELQALRAVWDGQGMELSPGMQRVLVTAVLVGPRIVEHPTYGRKIRALFVSDKPKKVAAPPAAPAAPQETPKAPNPPSRAATIEPDEDAMSAWEVI